MAIQLQKQTAIHDSNIIVCIPNSRATCSHPFRDQRNLTSYVSLVPGKRKKIMMTTPRGPADRRLDGQSTCRRYVVATRSQDRRTGIYAFAWSESVGRCRCEETDRSEKQYVRAGVLLLCHLSPAVSSDLVRPRPTDNGDCLPRGQAEEVLRRWLRVQRESAMRLRGPEQGQLHYLRRLENVVVGTPTTGHHRDRVRAGFELSRS